MITGVTRDDLPDGAARLYVKTRRHIHELSLSTGVELPAGDFRGHSEPINMVTETAPQVFVHNLETVPRILKKIRPVFRYERSLTMTQRAHDASMMAKSNLVLGMGETRERISEALHSLRSSGRDLLTVTQYLQPSVLHHPIDRWVHPKEFLEIAAGAEEMGFVGVMTGLLVCSLYRTGLLWMKSMKARGFEIPTCFAHLDGLALTLQKANTVLVKPHECWERRAAVRREAGAWGVHAGLLARQGAHEDRMLVLSP